MHSIQSSSIQNTSSIDALFAEFKTNMEKMKQKDYKNIPEVKTVQKRDELPQLPSPSGGLSLESIISALGFETRKVTCKTSLTSLEAKAQQQKEINEKQLLEIQNQLEKMASQNILDGFKKAFSIIGAIFGTLASAISVIAGAVTGNPLLVAAGVIGMTMAIDSTVSLASDGKYSLSAGFAKLGEAMGLSKENSQYFALGLQLLMTAINICLSFGAGFSNSTSSLATTANNIDKLSKLTNTLQKTSNISNGVLTTAQGSTTIASSVMNYHIDQAKINQKELDAILERIKESIQIEKSFIEAEIKRNNSLFSQLTDIIEEKNKTQQAILMGTPHYA